MAEALATVNVPESVDSLLVDASGRVLVACGEPLVVIDPGAREARRLDGVTLNALLALPEGRILCAGHGFALRDAATLEPRPLAGAIAESKNWVYAMSASADGTRLGVGGPDGWVGAWNLETGVRAARVRAFPDGDLVPSVALDPAGELLAVADRDHTTLPVFDLATGKQAFEIPHETKVNCVRWMPDGTLVTGSDGSADLWSSDGKHLRNLVRLTGRHTPAIWCIERGPHDRLALGDSADTIHLGSLGGGPFTTLAGHTDVVLAVAFSPDGRLLASAEEKSVRLWRLDA